MSQTASPIIRLINLLLNSAAVALASLILTMDGAGFLFWIVIGVFDGHWTEFFLPMLLVGLVLSFLSFLVIAAIFGVTSKLSEGEVKIRILMELSSLIDSGWERAIRTSKTSALIVLTTLVLSSILLWHDLLWWSALGRGMRAYASNRFFDASRNYEQSVEIASDDRKPASLFLLATSYDEAQQYTLAERYFVQAIDSIRQLPEDNRMLLVASYQGLARTLIKEKKYAAAERVARQAVKIFNTADTPLPPVRLRIIGGWSIPAPDSGLTLPGCYLIVEEACIKQGKFDEAQKAFEENLEKIKNLIRKDYRYAVQTAGQYAEMLAQAPQKRLDLLDQSYKETRQALIDAYGEESIALGKLEVMFADAYATMNQTELALKHYETGIELIKKNAKEGDYTLLKAMNKLAKILTAKGQLDKAEELYKEELSLVRSWKLASSDVQIQIDTCRSDYAELLRKQHRQDEASGVQPVNTTPAH